MHNIYLKLFFFIIANKKIQIKDEINNKKK